MSAIVFDIRDYDGRRNRGRILPLETSVVRLDDHRPCRYSPPTPEEQAVLDYYGRLAPYSPGEDT